jgi:hypothetical protein
MPHPGTSHDRHDTLWHLQSPGNIPAAVVLIGACLLLLVPGRLQAESAASKEYQVKAAFLFNFIRFSDWPSSSFHDSSSPISIGLLGDDPFGPALDEVIHGETVRGRAIVIRRSHSIADLQTCQLLYISTSEKDRLADIIGELDQHAVLIVSDIDHSAHHGGMIGFFQEGKRIRFEINAASAQEHQVKLSAQLLSLGRVVDVPGGKGHD